MLVMGYALVVVVAYVGPEVEASKRKRMLLFRRVKQGVLDCSEC